MSKQTPKPKKKSAAAKARTAAKVKPAKPVKKAPAKKPAARKRATPLQRRIKAVKKSYSRRKRLLRKSSRRMSRRIRKITRSRGAMVIIWVLIGILAGQFLAADGGGLFASRDVRSPGKVVVNGPAQADAQFSTYPTWAQNFASGSGKPDSRYWNIYRGAAPNSNHEAQYYTDDPANIRIGGGSLSLTGTRKSQPEGYKYASARIDTARKTSFLYGRIDVMAKLPRGAGTWPAVWLLPANSKYEDMSPSRETVRYINGGELDMLEAVGFNQNVNYGVVHTRSSNLDNPDGIGEFNEVVVPGGDTQYNLYTMLWTPDSITYAVNNQPFFTYTRKPGADWKTWPFDQPFYLIINLALGGIWGGQDKARFPGNGIDDSALPATLNIKSVYYYPYIGPQAK
jgi:beta-glucanase (GH16 family)